MSRLFASAAVVFLSAAATALSVSACQRDPQGGPSVTVAPTLVSTALPLTQVLASVVLTATPEPSDTPEPEPTAETPTTQPTTSRDISLTQQAGALQVTLLVSPGRAGYNEISLYFFDPSGVWITVQTVEIRITFLDVKSGTIVETVSPLHPGHAFISGDHLRHGGRWRIEAAFMGPGLEGAGSTFVVLIP